MSKKQYIGERLIKSYKKTKETTAGGTPIIKVEYEDGLVEHLSELMFGKIVEESSCNATELMKKRVEPVAEQVLMILREWGLKTGELPYFSQLLNTSLDYNRDAALLKLISDYMPKPLSLEDIDMICIDRVLRSTNDSNKPDNKS